MLPCDCVCEAHHSMSHRSPFTTRPRSSPSGATAAPSATHTSMSSSSYAHLHSTLNDADTSSDDDIDPRWTHSKVRAAAAAASASPYKSRREGAPAADTVGGMPRRNFTRAGFAPTPSPLDSTYLNTSGTTGRTTLDAPSVQRAWARGGTMDAPRAEGDTTNEDTSSAEQTFSGIPQPNVDLTGMTEEQRELLEYLQARVDAFERERVDFLQRLDEMAGSSSERHGLKWEVHKKDEQIMDLQKALSDAHVFLYEERAQVLKLTAENDRLKIQELEDRQRLEHLLALTQPINQEVTYFRECRPEKLTKVYPGQRDDIYAAQKDLSGVEPAQDSPRRQVLNTSASTAAAASNRSVRGGNGSGASTARAVGSIKKKSGAGSGGGGANMRPVVRTIYLPNENIEILKQIIASLRSQLQEQHTLYEQRVAALQEDRAIREQEAAEVARKSNAHIDELAKELKAVNDLNKMTTRDYLELRHAAQLSERKLKERASQLSQQHVELQKHLKVVEGRSARSESELQSENASYVSLFRAQTAATEEDLAIMKAQYAATQDLYEKRIRYLETRIANLKQKCKQGEQRRNLELEGYTNDVSGMRQKLRKLEHTLVQFKLAVQQAAQDEAAFATTSSSGSESGSAEAGSSTSRGRSASAAHLAQTQKRGGGRGGAKAGGGGGGGGLLPQRVAAQFAIMTDDVEKLQSELTSLARKISST